MGGIIIDEPGKENENDLSERRRKFYRRFFCMMLPFIIIILVIWTYCLTNSWKLHSPLLNYYACAISRSVLCCCISMATLLAVVDYVSNVDPFGSYINLFVCICGVTLFEIVLMASGYLYGYTGAESLAEAMHAEILQYTTILGSEESVDAIQASLKCCGKYNSSDWYDSPRGDIPMSCCPNEPSIGNFTNSCSYKSQYIFREGCVEKLLEIPMEGIKFIPCFNAIIMCVLLTFQLAKLSSNRP